MKKKKYTRILCLILSAVLFLGLFTGSLATVASAAAVTYQLTQLLADGKIKPLGRTQTTLAGDGITADWSGSGFDINVSGSGGTMTVGYTASYSAYWAILVDDVQVWRGYTASGTGTFGADIPAGSHTVRVVKETQITNSETGYSNLTTLTFGGTIEKAPANKSLYIEFVGASTACGDGALGEYEPGVKWLGAHDSATHAYTYYAAQKLNADYSIVARGGIGLFTGTSAQEGTEQKKGIQGIYNYTSGYNRTSNGEYSFSRQPNAVVITIGGNDSVNSSNYYTSIEYWKVLLTGLVDQVRAKNPDAHIILNTYTASKYKAMLEVAETYKDTDPKIHAFHYAYMGNGSAALTTQYRGHPDYKDLEIMGEALADFMKDQDIVPTYQSTPSYNDIVYYVSENGNDSNDGKTIDTAKKTLNAAVRQAKTDNTFAPGSRVVIYVQGTVKGSSNNAQGLVSKVTDTNGNRVPVLVTTYNYSGTKAVLNTGHAATNDGNGSIVFYNDVTLKDITFQSTTNDAKGYRDRNLYSGYGNTVTFDNVTFDMVGSTPTNNSGWRVVCGSAFGSDGLPAAGEGVSTIIFKNGDYTNLQMVSTTMSTSIWKSSTESIYEVPNGDFRVIIEDGAKMSTVYNRYGTLDVGKTSVTINGGSVNQYIGTANGTSSARKTYKGDINLTINGGEIYGTHFSTAGEYITLEGDINTTINGGIFEITPKSTAHNYDSYNFGGRENCIIENINTTITGGQLYLIFDVAGVDSAFYFGVAGSSATVKNVTNKISGGAFMPYARNATGKECNIFLGNRSGTITGTLRNEISGGTFQFGMSGLSERMVCVGSRGVNWPVGKIENVFGRKGTKFGPDTSSGILKLAGGWAQAGQTARQLAMPTTCSDTVVVSNTIYGGNYSTLYMGPSGNPSETDQYYTYVNGSIENNIYGGFFQGSVYGGGNGPVYGKVTTNVYGGFFKSIYGGNSSRSMIYDGVELNIYDLDEYYPVNPNDTWVICGGNASGKVPVPQTAGRDAIKFTIAPDKANDLVLNTRIKVGSTDGTASVAVSGGTFPRGFAVEGTTVGAALASGSTVFDASTGKKATFSASDASVSGSVVVDRDGESYTNELTYYVSEFGLDAYSGTSAVTPKKTLQAVFSEVISDNGSYYFPAGTKVTIYVEGTVQNATSTTSQILGGTQCMYVTGTKEHIPVTVTTLSGTDKAMIHINHMAANAGNGSTHVVNDLYFKDIDIQSLTNPATGYSDARFYAAGCNVTFDNCRITTDGKATKGDKVWNVYADHFYAGGFNPLNTSFHPHSGSVTFKNGDYTNLQRVAAVGASSIWRNAADGGSVYSVPEMSTKIIIEDGAHMGTVYNCFGTLAIGSATVEIRGGTVENFVGTAGAYLDGDTDVTFTYNTAKIENIVSGGTVKSFMGSGAGYYNSTSKAGQYITINGDVTNTFSGGTVGGAQLSGLNDYVKLNGNLTNNFTGGTVEIQPVITGDSTKEGIFLAGCEYAYVTGTVTNNVTGGSLGVLYTANNIKSGIWFGMHKGGKITGDLVNNVSGGEIYTRAQSGITPSYAAIHFGHCSTAGINGKLRNTITGGNFTTAKGSIYFGQQGTSGYMGGVVNVLGDKDTGNGPTFTCDGSVYLAGCWGKIGVSSNVSTLPSADKTTDTVVVSNTIYGGTYNAPVFATIGNTAASYVTFIQGSVENNVYGGTFRTFYGNGDAPTYGKVTTNIYGGTFNAIYGNRKATVYDGVELNIYGMTEGENPTGIWAAGTTPTISTVTSGRDAVKFTIQPTDGLTLSMPISAACTGTVTGTTSVLVTGGTYTNGFAVSGVTVKAALADGLVPLKDSDKTVVTVTDTMTTTGTDSVTLVSAKWTEDTAKLTLSDSTVTWDGDTDAKVPETIVKFHNSTLVKDTDYTVSYSRDGKATTDLNALGTVTVTVTAKAPYSGTLTATYTIVRDDAVGKAIADLTADVNALNKATITADDKSELASLKARIEDLLDTHDAVLTAEEKATLENLEKTRRELENVIVTVEATLDALVKDANAYSAATVTADDSEELAKLASDIAAIPDGNLTSAQKAEKQAAADKVDALQKVISDTAKALGDAKAEADKIDNATITADDSDDLAKLASDIAALPDGNLTSAQKTEKKAAADKVAAAQKVISDTAKALSDAKAAADKLDGNTVNSDDAAALAALETQINAIPDGNLTAAQKTEKQNLATKVDTLQQILDDTAKDLKELQEREAAFKTEELTSADKAKLEELAEEIGAYPQNNLTAGQKELLEQLAARVEDKIEVIEKAEQIAGDIDAIEALLEGKTESNVTSDDASDLAAAKKAIEDLKKDTSLSDADKTSLDALEKSADDLLARLDKADKANDVPEAVQDVTPDTVELTHKAALEEAIEKLEQAGKDYASNYTDAEKKAMEEDKAALEEALAVIEEVEAVQEQIAKLPETAEPDDEAAIKALTDAVAAYRALSEHQQAMVSEDSMDRMDQLAKALLNYQVTKGNNAEWNKESGKDLSFTANGLFAKFEGVLVDGSTVDSKFYTAVSGSTVITFSDDFLNTLSEGKHTLTVVYTDGEAEGTFTVKAKAVTPPTGDSAQLVLMGMLALLSVTAAAAMTVIVKKRTR